MSSSLIPTSINVRTHSAIPGESTSRPPGTAHEAASITNGASASSAQPERSGVRKPLARHSPRRVTSHTAKTVHATLAASPAYQPVMPTNGTNVTTARMIANRAM